MCGRNRGIPQNNNNIIMYNKLMNNRTYVKYLKKIHSCNMCFMPSSVIQFKQKTRSGRIMAIMNSRYTK